MSDKARHHLGPYRRVTFDGIWLVSCSPINAECPLPPPSSQVMVNTEKERASLLYMHALVSVDAVSHHMASHPQYLESFLRSQHYILHMDGPLPLPCRHYIAIMVGGAADVHVHIHTRMGGGGGCGLSMLWRWGSCGDCFECLQLELVLVFIFSVSWPTIWMFYSLYVSLMELITSSSHTFVFLLLFQKSNCTDGSNHMKMIQLGWGCDFIGLVLH